MDARPAEPLRRGLEDESLAVLPAVTREQLRTAPLLRQLPHGTTVAFTTPGAPGAPARTLEMDAAGNVLALFAWSGAGLSAAWARLPDGSWLRIEPSSQADASVPWAVSDRLWRCSRPGDAGEALTVFEALDYRAVTRIPTLWDPGRLPAGGGSIVLNVLASLAEDQGVPPLTYEGPFPTEQLFLALLESFRPAGAPGEPLAEFMRGALAWTAAPYERRLLPGGVYVQERARVERIVWRQRTYHRQDWWGVRRHAPRRVEDTQDGPVAGLWFLGECLDRHLVVGPGDRVRMLPPVVAVGEARRLGDAVVAGLGAIIAATGALALAPFVPDVVSELGAAWGPVDGDLIETIGRPLVFSTRIRSMLAPRVARAPQAERAAIALAALGEMAALAADVVRPRAQARLAGSPDDVRERTLRAPPPLPADTAARITRAVEALLDDLHEDRARL